MKILQKIKESQNTLSLVIAVSAIVVVVFLNWWNYSTNFNNRIRGILAVGEYNKGILNTYVNVINEGEDKLFANQFRTEMYYDNLDVFGALKGDCRKTHMEFLAGMEAINTYNNSILYLYNQEGIISVQNQWKNTKEREGQWRKDLKEKVLEVDDIFSELATTTDCGFVPYGFGFGKFKFVP